MKHFATHFSVLLAALVAVSSCDGGKLDADQGNEPPAVLPTPVPEYLFALGGSSVCDGSIDMMNEGDSVGLFVVKQGSVFALAAEAFIAEGGAKLAFEFDSPEGIVAGDVIYAYAPYSCVRASRNPSETVLSVPAIQSCAGNSFDETQLPRVASPFAASHTLPVGRKVLAGELSMIPLYAMAEFVLSSSLSSYAGQEIRSVTWTSEGLSGDFTYDLTSAIATLPALSGNTVQTNVTDLYMPVYGRDTKVFMAVAPGEHGGLLTISTDTQDLQVELEPCSFAAGLLTSVEVRLESGTIAGSESFREPDEFEW